MRETFGIGQAVKEMQYGKRVCRSGWNGKGMFLILVPGSSIPVAADRPLGRAAPELVGQTMEYLPHVDMKTADGKLVPWLCSQTDLLAVDWQVVE